MAREDTPLDQAVFDATMQAERAKGPARRVAEGRARSAAVRAYRAAHPEEEAAREAAAPARAPAAAGGDGGRAAPAPAAAATAAAPGAVAVAAPPTIAAPVREAPLPTGNVPEPKRGAPEKHRLLVLVPLAALTVFSTFVNAPLRELANPNLTPNPSKAPWYFLGLQELLRYFHPMVAGVTIPTFILVGLAAVPFIDRNPSTKPGDRKLAITLFTMLFMFGATLTIIGSFFRGPGFNWVWPWSQGLFFEL